MSSFDDAIRQHLDLKRRRGADPRKVAEIEREALGFPPDDGPRASGGWHQQPLGPAARARSRSQIDEETMEIDMTAVIERGDVDDREFFVKDNRQTAQAYDWSMDGVGADISDPRSIFEWEIPTHGRLRGAA